MMTIREPPNMSATAGPRLRTHIMFSPMWMMPACSHPALSTVHHMPSMNTGPAPLAPSIRLMVGWADSMPNGLPPPMMLPPKYRVSSRLMM